MAKRKYKTSDSITLKKIKELEIASNDGNVAAIESLRNIKDSEEYKQFIETFQAVGAAIIDTYKVPAKIGADLQTALKGMSSIEHPINSIDFQSIAPYVTRLPSYDDRLVDTISELKEEIRLLRSEKKESQAKRKRGPSADILENCEVAMKFWLDKSISLTIACDRTGGVDKKTVRKWIPNVLEITDEETRIVWIKILKALREDKYLGKFREV